MTLLMGIDLETTGLDPAMDEIIEAGIVLWDTEPNRIVSSFSLLVSGVRVPEEIIYLTGITPKMRADFGAPIASILGEIEDAAKKCDYLVAHNAGFERSFLLANGMRSMVEGSKWIDTKYDIPYPPHRGRGSLNDIAMSHRVYNPMPHRAAPDALAMMQVLAQYPFSQIERMALAPAVVIEIRFPYDPVGDANARVRSLGYNWNRESKCWRRTVKDFQLEGEIAEARASGFSPTTTMALGV